jgi:hypothetical protein
MRSRPSWIDVPKVTARLCPHRPSILSPQIERASPDLARIEVHGGRTREVVIALKPEASASPLSISFTKLSEDVQWKEQD